MKRLAFKGLVTGACVLAPVAASTWIGCSSDETPSAGMTQVDPGGTFGAEVSITVVGRGRVIGAIPGSTENAIDCPTRCYLRYTFANAQAPGANAGLALRAIPTQGVTFKGYTFGSDPLGTKGRGPDNCNPVTRPASQAPGDSSGAEITLPFGETNGTPPAGQEGACGANLTVPVAYKIVATFEEPPAPPDAGPEGGDAGPSPGEILFDQPVAGATGGELGISGSRLYWKYHSGSYDGIASGSTSSTAGSTPVNVFPPSQTLPQFDVGLYYVVFQDSSYSLHYVSAGSTFSSTVTTSPPSGCAGVTSDSSGFYCRNGSTLYSWSTSGTGPYTEFTGVPTSSDKFGADSSYFYFANDPGTTGSATIQRLTRDFVRDGGVASPSTIVSSQTKPIHLMVRSSYLFWINYDSFNNVGELRSSYYGGTTAYIGIPATNGLQLLGTDSSSSSSALAGIVGTGAIYRVFGESTSNTLLVSGIPNLTGIAADSSYVYWTQNDGRVYRKSR